jgi:hypothetical protein
MSSLCTFGLVSFCRGFWVAIGLPPAVDGSSTQKDMEAPLSRRRKMDDCRHCAPLDFLAYWPGRYGIILAMGTVLGSPGRHGEIEQFRRPSGSRSCLLFSGILVGWFGFTDSDLARSMADEVDRRNNRFPFSFVCCVCVASLVGDSIVEVIKSTFRNDRIRGALGGQEVFDLDFDLSNRRRLVYTGFIGLKITSIPHHS